MIRVNIHDAKTHFSEYLAKLEAGENIVICKRNIPIAEIRPIPHRPLNPRPIGLAKQAFDIAPAFFEPLPQELLDDFNGKES